MKSLTARLAALALTVMIAMVPARATAAPPTLHRLDRDAEGRNRERREAWIEGMHRAAPGVKWREIEAANTAENFLRREAGFRPMGGPPWTEVGANNVTGRTHVTALAPNGFDLYVGSERGGMWQGNLGGGPWAPRSNEVGAGVHHLVYVGGAPDVIVTATNGGGIYYSDDGGSSWHVPGGLPEYVWQCVRLVHEVGSSRVYLLIEGWRWIGSWDHSYQLYRSSNGGVTFSYLRSDPMETRPDIWMDRVSPGQPLFLVVGSTLLRSTNFGTSFSPVGTTPASGDLSVLVGSEAGAPTLYAALRVSGTWKLYRSIDAGTTWSYRSDLPDFWESLCASITSANHVFYGGVDGYRSIDGGAAFTLINHWYEYYADPASKLHADVMGIDAILLPIVGPHGTAAMPPPTDAIYFNTDGGTYVSYDLGASFANLTQNGLHNAQYYGILTSRRNSRLIAAGSQDQGYQLSTPTAASPLSFTQIISGDYGHLTSSSGTHDLLWSVYPGFILLQVAEGSTALEYPEFPPTPNHDWMPNILADPDDPNRLYFCADHLWRIQRTAPGVYSYLELPQSFASVGGEYLTAFAISPVDHDHWYAATNQGALWYSDDAGANWLLSGSPGPGPHYFYGTELLPSPTDANLCFVGGSGYSNPAVYRTSNGGADWSPYASGLPSTLVLGLAFNNDIEQQLYAATEAGPFRYDSGAGGWVNLLASSCCAPLTTYWDVEGLPHQGTVRFATHGRGIWDIGTGSIVGVPDPGTGGTTVDLAVWPSPVRQRAKVSFTLAHAGRTKVEVFDVAGHRVATLVTGMLAAGKHVVDFDLRSTSGRRLDSGIYLVRAITPSGIDVRKLHVAR